MEIKVRAWHELNKEMVYPKIGGLSSGDILNRFSPEWIMQFTGLQDKNGKDIYVGDIIQTLMDDGEVVNTGDIQFSHGVFGAEWVSYKEKKSTVGGWGQRHNLKTLDDDIIERIVVVGHIFEIPENA